MSHAKTIDRSGANTLAPMPKVHMPILAYHPALTPASVEFISCDHSASWLIELLSHKSAEVITVPTHARTLCQYGILGFFRSALHLVFAL